MQTEKELIDFQENSPILEILTNLLEFRLQILLHSLNLEIPERRRRTISLKLNFFLLFFSEKKRRDDNMYIEGAVLLGNRGEGRTGNPGISTGLTAQDV